MTGHICNPSDMRLFNGEKEDISRIHHDRIQDSKESKA